MPTPEHIEALALVLDPANIKSRSYLAVTPHEAAEALYAAIVTDPAAQDAVLAALVEGGRLIEERTHGPVWDECTAQCAGAGLVLPDGDPWPSHSHGPSRWVTKVRLVETEWREVGV